MKIYLRLISLGASFTTSTVKRMEFVALSDTVLKVFGKEDPRLKPMFVGVFPADKVPSLSKQGPHALIVNTDPAGKPGEHWLALFIQWGCCEVFDSFALPLKNYPTLQPLWKRWSTLITSNKPLQSLDTYTCGHYSTLFLKARARDESFEDFLAPWSTHNFVLNDMKVGEKIDQLIKKELFMQDLKGAQSCVTRACFVNE